MKLLILILILCFTVKADPLKPLPIDFLDKKEIKKQQKKQQPKQKKIKKRNMKI